MAITRDADKVMHGIANIYFGAKDEALPDEDTVGYGGDWGSGWDGVGYTEDGVEIESSVDADDIKPSETKTPIDVLVTGSSFVVRFVVMEHTLEMMKLAFGGGTITTTAAGASNIGKSVLTLSNTLDSYALGFEVENDLGFWDRLYIPHVKSVATVSTPFALDKVRMFPVEFRGLCDPTEIEYIRKTANATA